MLEMSEIELPQHYFPVTVCPHVGPGPNRLMFADYGSYQNINVKINAEDSREKISFLPQKGQGSLQNTNSRLPSLPLFDHPLQGEWREWDAILGMKSFSAILKDLRCMVQTVPRFKGFIQNKPDSNLAHKFKMLKEMVTNPDVVFSDPDKGLQNLVSSYTHITNVSNNNCLNGFNRDFYGGLLNISRAVGTDSHSMVHASGKGLHDIFWTNVSQDPLTRLKSPEIISKLSLDAQVYGLSTSNKIAGKMLISAREKNSCLLLVADVHERTLLQRDIFDSPGERLSHTWFSPYMENELLLSTESGTIYLWDINSGCRVMLEKTARFECKDKWSSAYFGGHPRQIVVADNTSLEIFDHRSHFSDGQELFSLSSHLIKANERVMAAAPLGFPYHVVATDYTIFVMDQRFGSSPVLQWSTEFKACPQYLQVIDQSSRENNTGKLIFLASQQPAEVMCFQLDVTSGQSPTSTLLPWKVSPIGEFSESLHTNYTTDPSSSDRFQASLAGVAVTQQSRSDGFTVYQMDSYGDIFYQTIESHKTISDSERNASKLRSSHWLQQLDEIGRKRSVVGLEATSKQVFLDPEIMKDVFAYPLHNQDVTAVKTSREDRKTPLHRNLKPVERLPSKGYNAQLHLALRDNRDIKEILKLREARDQIVKIKLREKTLKKLRKRKSSRRKPPPVFKHSDSDDTGDAESHSVKTRSTSDNTDAVSREDPDQMDINLEDFVDQLNISQMDSDSLDIDRMDIDLLHEDLDHSFNSVDGTTKTLASNVQVGSFTRSDAPIGKSGTSLLFAVNQNRVGRSLQKQPDKHSGASPELENSGSSGVHLDSLSLGDLGPSGHPVFIQPATTVVPVRKKRYKVVSPSSDTSLSDSSLSSTERTKVKTLVKSSRGTPRRRSTVPNVSKNMVRTRAKRKKESSKETLPSVDGNERIMAELSLLNIGGMDEPCRVDQTGKTCPISSQQMAPQKQASGFYSLESYSSSSVLVSPGGLPSQSSQANSSSQCVQAMFQKSNGSPPTQRFSTYPVQAIKTPPLSGQEIKTPPLSGQEIKTPPLSGQEIKTPPLSGQEIKKPPLSRQKIKTLPLSGLVDNTSPMADVATPPLHKASHALSLSPSLFSNLSGYVPTPSKLGGAVSTTPNLSLIQAGSLEAISSSQMQPNLNILMWLSTNDLTSTSPSTNRLSPGDCLTSSSTNKLSPGHCLYKGIKSPLADEGDDKNPIRRKLTFNAFSEGQVPTNIPSVINQPSAVDCVFSQSTSLQQSDDSDCSDSMDSLCSSLPASVTSITLATPQLRRFIDPSLSGFLSSPRMQSGKKSKQLRPQTTPR